MISISLTLSFIFSPCLIHCFSLTVLHTNDVHGRFEEINQYGTLCAYDKSPSRECYGGVARRAAMIKKLRATDTNVILLDAGDEFTGTVWNIVHKGKATSYFMNYLHYDAMALGNHEFDRGIPGVLPFLRAANFSVVISNLDVSNEPLWPQDNKLYSAYTILNVSGEMVGVVGYILPQTVNSSNPGPNLKFLPEVSAVQKAVNELKKKGVNKIIALGHSGINVDKEIAKNVQGVDIVVGGHTNTFLYTGTPPTTDKRYGLYPILVHPPHSPSSNVLVVQDFAYGKYLGRLHVDFNSKGEVISCDGNPVLLDEKVQKDKQTVKEMKPWQTDVDKIANEKIGECSVPLDGHSCRLGECNLGNVMADSFVRYYADNATIGIMNSGSIAASIYPEKDWIIYGHIINCSPYMNTVDLLKLKGKDILETLEFSVMNYDKRKPSGRFLQVSGLQVKYDITQPPGSRVTEVKVKCTKCNPVVFLPLEHDTVYGVATQSYIAKGGGGYSVLTRSLSRTIGGVDVDVIAMFIKHVARISGDLEGRIQIKDDTKSGAPCTRGCWLSCLALVFIILFFIKE